jgi:hypothetical protein
MRRIQVWRYICDHCGKRNLSGGHMRTHEKGCTANPQRTCRFHPHLSDEPQRPMSELLEVLGAAPDFGMSELRRRAANCPMCILSAIRQSGIIQKWDGDPESQPIALGFDFKAELKAAWQTINDANGAA